MDPTPYIIPILCIATTTFICGLLIGRCWEGAEPDVKTGVAQMSGDEVKRMLETYATSLETFKSVFPPETANNTLRFLSVFDENAMTVLAPLVNLVTPMTKEELTDNVDRVTKMVTNAKNMTEEGNIDALINTCRRWEKRPRMLGLIGKFLRE